MAEGGVVEGLLGESDEAEPQFEPEKLDPLAAALAVEATRGDPEVAKGVLNYFEDLSQLVRLQIKHFDEERRLAIAAAKRKRVSDWVRNGLQIVLALAVAGVVAGLGAMAWSAHNDRGLTIQALETPPDLAAQGLSGQVLAAELQDKIVTLQHQTVTGDQAAQVSDSRATDIQIEIPETGISLGELNRFLRDWLGHETRVSGEVARTGGGLAMTVRVGDGAGERSVRPDGDVDALLQSAAESVYRAIEPFRYGQWLDEHGRSTEAVALWTELSQSGPPQQRARADVLLSNGASVPLQAARALVLEAVRLDPGLSDAWGGLAGVEGALGHNELALRAYARDEQAIATQGGLTPEGRRLRALTIRRNVANLLGSAGPTFERTCLQLNVAPCTIKDMVDAAASVRPGASDVDFFQAIRLATLTGALARAHDPEDALRVLAAPRVDLAGRSEDYRTDVASRWLGASIAVDLAREDWASVLRDTDDFHTLVAKWPTFSTTIDTYALDRAYALAKLGRQAEAEAAVANTPLDCYRCLTTRGQIAAIKADWPTADRWFAMAAKAGPSLPQAYDEWGQALLARGDLAAAIAKFDLANRKSPQFADPLKDWGDALARQGQWRAALAKYDEALKYAPTWPQLQQARDIAAKHAG